MRAEWNFLKISSLQIQLPLQYPLGIGTRTPTPADTTIHGCSRSLYRMAQSALPSLSKDAEPMDTEPMDAEAADAEC